MSRKSTAGGRRYMPYDPNFGRECSAAERLRRKNRTEDPALSDAFEEVARRRAQIEKQTSDVD